MELLFSEYCISDLQNKKINYEKPVELTAKEHRQL